MKDERKKRGTQTVVDAVSCAVASEGAASRGSVAALPLSDSIPASTDSILIRGAKTNNLRNVDVDIPLGRMTVVTGVSGSGKSSLVWETLFAEGRYRYLATVSPRMRELMQRLVRPDVDLIDGLPPTLGIEQRTRGPRRRTTLATVVEIYDYLRLLFARVGRLHCPTCGQPVSSQSRESIVEQVLQLGDRRKVLVLSPIVRQQPGSHGEVFARIVRDGFVRARVDGELVDAATPPVLAANKPHSIDVVVDRLILKEGIRGRLEESVDLALQLGQGQCILSHEVDGVWQDRLYSSRLACAACDASFPSLEPGDFSFNSPRGACPECHGLGVLPAGTGINPKDFPKSGSCGQTRTCEAPEKRRKSVGSQTRPQPHRGSDARGNDAAPCPGCNGRRLASLPQSVLICGMSITEFVSLSPGAALPCVENWSRHFESDDVPDAERHAARHVLPEIAARLQMLGDLGLDYLTLDRSGDSLSSGEFQRARLAACLGGQLTGVCYVIDEPTAGLHARDTARLLRTLFTLRDQGNTVVLVEHDLEVMRQADCVIDIGPGAGLHGGRLLAAGSPDEISRREGSRTGEELRRRSGSLPSPEKHCEPNRWLTLTGATLHNLQNVTLELPVGALVCVTGVSGSGKTSLVTQTLVPAVRRALGGAASDCGPYRELLGVDAISNLVCIDQSPLGRSGRSTPATYSGVWDELRKVFAKTKEARMRGFTPRRFSPQHAEGRCPRCAGRGTLDLDKKSLVEWSVCCPDCGGRRFNWQTLAVRYRGVSVADVLEMSLEKAAVFFVNLPRLARPLALFCELGLGYLKLGQSATTLSGGEAQRVKLVTELSKSDGSLPTLFVLDEPTAGLHAADVRQLLAVLRRLVDAGHSIVVIEHNLESISAADWIVDIGPEAGQSGGRIAAAGTPQQVMNCESSLTGAALRNAFRSEPQSAENHHTTNQPGR
jgi:excinuclease ABC subunit A